MSEPVRRGEVVAHGRRTFMAGAALAAGFAAAAVLLTTGAEARSAATRYMGAVDYNDGSTALGRTLVRINTP